MKTKSLFSAALLTVVGSALFSLTGCQKSEDSAVKPNTVTPEVLAQIKAMGFDDKGVTATEGGFRVEGDMLLTPEVLGEQALYSALRVGNDEQYRTTNLVTGLPRTITVSISSQFPSAYVTAVDEAIRRYNAARLQLSFRRVSSGAQMPIQYAADLGPGVLGQSGGFPSNGNPAPGFKLVPNVINSSNVNYIATIMAHEMGHCIGFRHTDYMNRQYSCGGSAYNEGASSIGAIRIPGTPAAADPNSWMLACVGTNVNRPFNSNDITALNYLY